VNRARSVKLRPWHGEPDGLLQPRSRGWIDAVNRRNTIPFVISILLLAGLASAHRAGTLATPQADAPTPKPSASTPPKEKPKPPKADQPKKPPPDEGGW